MGSFNAPEFGSLPYAVPPDASYSEILSEALSERCLAARFSESTRFAYLSLAVSNAGRRLGLFEHIDASFATALAIFEDARDLRGAAWVHWSQGNLDQQSGDHRRAAIAFSKSYGLARRAGDPVAARYALAGRAEIARILGYYAEARAQHLLLRGQFRDADDPRGVVWANEGLAQMDMRQNRLARARSAFSEALESATMIGDRRGAAWARRGMAETALRAGDTGTAILLARLACQEFKRAGVNIGSGYAQLTLTRAHRVLGDQGAAEAAMQNAETMFLAGHHRRGRHFMGIERSLMAVRFKNDAILEPFLV